MIKRWWERHPERLNFEIDSLKKLGASFTLDEKSFERGVVLLKGDFTVCSEKIYLEIVYPDHYPYFRFHAYAPHLDLRYHQQPFQKSLCLLHRSTRAWDYADTAASLLTSQLPKVLKANDLMNREEVLEHELKFGYELETREPEPIERFMTFEASSHILFDSKWKLTGSNGALVIGFKEMDKEGGLQGSILEVRDHNNRILYTAAPALSNLYLNRIKGRWQRSEKPIISNDPAQYLKQLAKFNRAVSVVLPQPARHFKTDMPKGYEFKIDVVASVYEDETSHRHRNGTLSWVFVARWIVVYNHAKTRKKITDTLPFFIRGERAGRDDMMSRVPELRGLSEKKIALVGLGCLGSQCAIEFAKAGIAELRILDGDDVSAGNAPRWVLGLSAAGKSKTEAIKQFIQNNYPHTRVVDFSVRLGDSNLPNQDSQNEIVEKMLSGVDIILDATAEEGVQNFLADMAREKSIPYVFVSTTPGTWGGRIVRFRPGKTEGCCQCLRHHIEQGELPVPNTDVTAAGEVIPVGCAEPTFTGNNFDASQISLAGVRTTISTLMEGIPGGYPSIPWDIEIINVRDAAGNITSLQSITAMIKRHPACENHR